MVAVAGQWREARLDPVPDRHAWRGWHFEWHATPGEHELMCRATDANGDAQPIEQRFGRGGFGNNAVRSWSARPVGRHGLEIAPH